VQLPAGRVRPGRIEHALGWPAALARYAGSFLYHLDDDRVYVGYIVGLDYQDPRLQPFEAFQQYKNHPSVKALLEGGEIVSAGARAIAARRLAVDADTGDAGASSSATRAGR